MDLTITGRSFYRRSPAAGQRTGPLFVCLLATLTMISPAAEPKALPGPVEELSILDDFTTESQSAWNFSAGTNVNWKAEAGRNIPGIATSVMQIEMSTEDPTNRIGGYN